MEKSRKVLLVFPGQKTNPFQKKILINLPLGVLQLAAYIRDRGYEPVIHDTRVEDKEGFLKKAEGALAVGFSCMTGYPVKCALEYASELKQASPSTPVIFGGIHPTLLPEETASHPLVDFVVIGEGEESLYRLLEALRSGTGDYGNIQGLAYKAGGGIKISECGPLLSLDDLPMPAYELADMGRYANIKTNFTYQSSRGCPYRCGFCYNLRFSNRRYRAKSAARVVADLEYLVNKYGLEKIGFVDDEFFISQSRTEEFCDLLIQKKLDIEWNASCRLDLIRKYPDELLQKIRKSGCKSMNYGAESGSARILEYMNKDITPEDIIEGARHTAANGIKSFLSFMAGFPEEKPEDTLETKRIIELLWKEENGLILPNTIYPYNPFPGTTLFDDAVKKGMLIPKDLEGWGEWNFLYNPKFPWITREHNDMIKVLFGVARFRFYLRELNDRAEFNPVFRMLVKIGMSPWIISGNLRWKYGFYKWAWEWDLWIIMMQRIFGFI